MARSSIARYVAYKSRPRRRFPGKPRVCAASYHDARLTIMHSWTRLKSPHGQFRRVRPEHTQPLPHDRVVTLETQPTQLLLQPDRSDVRLALQQLCDTIVEAVQPARPSR